MTCGSVNVGVEEAAVGGVVIARLQIVEAGFGIVVITAIAQGILIRHAAGFRQKVAPCVVFVACDFFVFEAGDITDELYNVTLQVQDIVIRREAAAAVR